MYPPQSSKPKLTRQEATAISFLSAGISLAYLAVNFDESSVWREATFNLALLGIGLGVILFIVAGVTRVQKHQKNVSFHHAALSVMAKVGLFIILPSVVISAGIIIWATITGRFPVD